MGGIRAQAWAVLWLLQSTAFCATTATLLFCSAAARPPRCNSRNALRSANWPPRYSDDSVLMRSRSMGGAGR